ncbi:AAA family ATPase [Pedobacter sp. Leaf176]|uniref:AAA family ATPase n=1 Tax=Pedobacter sp. Leaf176 TaxID=1736286 RepID=UPI0018D22180|nr:AAA family ATPase [Pedobacter sp. Leaf176]
MIINKLIYHIQTDDGKKYGAEIPFRDGLNIIFGPNSVGKTSIVTGIVYGLGAEKGLGVFKSIQNPFKPEFYKEIDNKRVARSYLLLEISNGEDVVTIFRYIAGGDNTIAAIKSCPADQFYTNPESERLIVVGEGVFSENGFQTFLFSFLGLRQVELPTYDRKLSKLYFENILPLFFVEQRAGWSQIQARQVLRYNIKDIKKVAFEFLFGMDRFKIHISEIRLKELDLELKKIIEELSGKEENLFVISDGEKSEDVLIVNTDSIGKASISDYINYLDERYKVEANLVESAANPVTDFEDSKINLREKIKVANYQLRKANERLEKISLEINEYEKYLERIQLNKYKNKQLKKIKEAETEINITTCPVCEAKLLSTEDDECKLCHSDLRKKLSTPDQNLKFLEDEEATFKKVIEKRLLDRRKVFEQRNNLKDEISGLEKELDHQITTFAGSDFAILRQRILNADSLYKDLERFKRVSERWNGLTSLRQKIKTDQAALDKLKAEVDAYKQTADDQKTIDTIKTFLQENVKSLGLFKKNRELIAAIRLDASDNYTPYLDNYDIYNISSSSDNIRIILSYYLALLQTSIELKTKGKIIFPDILVLDEPKQQNLDNDSLIDCIKVMADLPVNSGQIILTTYSELPEDKLKLSEYIVYEMHSKTDYLLKPI